MNTLHVLISIHILMHKTKSIKHIKILENGHKWLLQVLLNVESFHLIELLQNIVEKFGTLSQFLFLIHPQIHKQEQEVLQT
jgi:hypothetical protein